MVTTFRGTRIFSLNVTEECIEAGEPVSESMCPIAYAAVEAGLSNVSVGGDYMEFHDPKTGETFYNVELPDVAVNFIDDFDQGYDNFTPFTFQVEAKAE